MKTQNLLRVPVLVEDEATGQTLENPDEALSSSTTHHRANEEDLRWALLLMRHMGQ